MQDQHKLFEQSEAVKEYRFITEQIKTMDDPKSVNLTGIDFSSLDKLPDRGKKIIEEHNYMKIKIDNL
jgi:hypothetical protein